MKTMERLQAPWNVQSMHKRQRQPTNRTTWSSMKRKNAKCSRLTRKMWEQKCSELCPCAGCSDVFEAVIVAHPSSFSSEIASIRADLMFSIRKLNHCLQQELQRKSSLGLCDYACSWLIIVTSITSKVWYFAGMSQAHSKRGKHEGKALFRAHR